MCVCTGVSLGTLKDQKRTLESSELDLQADVTCSIQVLGTLFGSPARAIHAINHGAISLTPQLARLSWERGTSRKELPPSALPVGLFVGLFLD